MPSLPEPDRAYTFGQVKRQLGTVADQLERLDARRRDLEERRRAWMVIAKSMPDPHRPDRPMGYRMVAQLARITNPRAHQILTNPRADLGSPSPEPD